METLREELLQLAEPEYQKFNCKLIPNVAEDKILGVRLPMLRKIAMRIAKGDWREYLKTAKSEYYEEIMLQGMAIGYADMAFGELLHWIEWFLPKIDNWAVCDSFCAGLKRVQGRQEEFLPVIKKCLASGETYSVRFGIVMLLDYFMKEEYLQEALQLCDEVSSGEYYVQMAVAWTLSMYYVHFPEQVMPYLMENHLDDFTYNKTLQKIVESRKISKEEKERIKQMKRKKQKKY